MKRGADKFDVHIRRAWQLDRFLVHEPSRATLFFNQTNNYMTRARRMLKDAESKMRRRLVRQVQLHAPFMSNIPEVVKTKSPTKRTHADPNAAPRIPRNVTYSSIFSTPPALTTPALPSPRCFNSQLRLKYVFGCTIVSRSVALQLPSSLTFLISRL